MADRFQVTVDGRAVEAREGWSVAATLVESGALAWRETRRLGEGRGLFCGIGVCFDCLVTLNGITGVRSCLVDVRPGDEVVIEKGSGHGPQAV